MLTSKVKDRGLVYCPPSIAKGRGLPGKKSVDEGYQEPYGAVVLSRVKVQMAMHRA